MVTKKPKGLGLGLEALLGPRVREPGDAGDAHGRPHVLRLAQLQPGRYQPRTRMDEASLRNLAQSITAQGVMQPILVRPLGAERFEIIAGERRMRAAQLAGLDEVPVLVREVADEAAAVMALIENIQREDLNRSRSAASNLLRLLNLAPPVQQMLMQGDLDMGHARALLALDGAVQVLRAQEICAKGLSVRQAEDLVARSAAAGAPARRRTKAQKPRELLRIEQQLSDILTAEVDIRVKKRTPRGEQGELAIAFGSLDELNGLLARLGLESP